MGLTRVHPSGPRAPAGVSPEHRAGTQPRALLGVAPEQNQKAPGASAAGEGSAPRVSQAPDARPKRSQRWRKFQNVQRVHRPVLHARGATRTAGCSRDRPQRPSPDPTWLPGRGERVPGGPRSWATEPHGAGWQGSCWPAPKVNLLPFSLLWDEPWPLRTAWGRTHGRQDQQPRAFKTVSAGRGRGQDNEASVGCGSTNVRTLPPPDANPKPIFLVQTPVQWLKPPTTNTTGGPPPPPDQPRPVSTRPPASPHSHRFPLARTPWAIGPSLTLPPK